jgi:dienelactone hydrolase
LASVDPVEDARNAPAPLYVIQGGRDYQSTPADLELWEDALGGQPGFSSKLYPDLNHLFMSGSGKATPEEYVTEVGFVAEEVISEMAAWILGIDR